MDPLTKFQEEMAQVLKTLIGRLEQAAAAIGELKKLPVRIAQVEKENDELRKRVEVLEAAVAALKQAQTVVVTPPAPPSKPSAWDELVAGITGKSKPQ